MWLRLDMMDGKTIFVERKECLSNFICAVNDGNAIKILRKVVIIPTKNEMGQPVLAPIDFNKASPFSVFCTKNEEHININGVISFGVVDEKSNEWKVVMENVFGDRAILTPSKDIVIP